MPVVAGRLFHAGDRGHRAGGKTAGREIGMKRIQSQRGSATRTSKPKMSATRLRARCINWLGEHTRMGITRTGDPVQHLMEFVMSEIGRTADEKLEDTFSLILYFRNDRDRQEMIDAVMQVKPGMVARKIP